MSFLITLFFILTFFKNNKAGVTAVEYAVVAAGVISVMIFICIGNDSTMGKLFINLFNKVVSSILTNISHALSS